MKRQYYTLLDEDVEKLVDLAKNCLCCTDDHKIYVHIEGIQNGEITYRELEIQLHKA